MDYKQLAVERKVEMAKIVNLRQFSKQKQREAKSKQASENAAKFGQTKAERAAALKRNEDMDAHLDRHKRDDP
jgi:hypothetical protein